MRAALVTASCLVWASSAPAQDAGSLYDVLRLDEVIEIVRDEGVAYADDLRDDLFPGRAAAGWTRMVADLHDLGEMQERVREDFAAGMPAEDVAPVVAFFETAAGAEILQLEIEARRAMSNDDVADAAEERARILDEAGDPLLDEVWRFIEVNDLVAQNVAAALNSNIAFYTGLAEGGALDWSDARILDEVKATAEDVRADTEGWLLGFLTLAYAPLPDGALADYVALSETAAGQSLNTALIGAFDGLLQDKARALGLAAAGVMASQDL